MYGNVENFSVHITGIGLPKSGRYYREPLLLVSQFTVAIQYNIPKPKQTRTCVHV